MTNEEMAEDHFGNALVAHLAGNQTETAIAEFEKALALGLPGKKEAFARLLLGGEYAQMAVGKDLSEAQTTRLPEWTRAEAEMIAGLQLDREGAHGQFSDRNGRATLFRLDILCAPEKVPEASRKVETQPRQ